MSNNEGGIMGGNGMRPGPIVTEFACRLHLFTIDRDGSGDGMPIAKIEAYEAEAREAERREDLLCDIHRAYLDDLPTAALERIAAIIGAERGDANG